MGSITCELQPLPYRAEGTTGGKSFGGPTAQPQTSSHHQPGVTMAHLALPEHRQIMQSPEGMEPTSSGALSDSSGKVRDIKNPRGDPTRGSVTFSRL